MYFVILAKNFCEFANVDKLVASILKQNIPNFGVLVVCQDLYNSGSEKVESLFFDESVDGNQDNLSKKRNLAASHLKAKGVNADTFVVYLHSYFQFPDGWYANLDLTKEDQVVLNPIKRPDGGRYLDWMQGFIKNDTRWRYKEYGEKWDINSYISAAYFIVKLKVILENKFNERLKWRQEDDVEWSRRLHLNNVRVRLCQSSVVHLSYNKFNHTD